MHLRGAFFFYARTVPGVVPRRCTLGLHRSPPRVGTISPAIYPCPTLGSDLAGDRAKHIDTRIYRVRELSSGDAPEVEVYKIAGEFQPADIFTKGLPRAAFERHLSMLMGEHN